MTVKSLLNYSESPIHKLDFSDLVPEMSIAVENLPLPRHDGLLKKSPHRCRAAMVYKNNLPPRCRDDFFQNLPLPRRCRDDLFKNLPRPRRYRDEFFKNLSQPRRHGHLCLVRTKFWKWFSIDCHTKFRYLSILFIWILKVTMIWQ